MEIRERLMHRGPGGGLLQGGGIPVRRLLPKSRD